MDGLEKLISGNKIPLGMWGKSAVEWITGNFEWFFDAISVALKAPIDVTKDLLFATPAFLFIALVAGLAYYLQRSWWLVLFVVLGLLLILNQGLWEPMLETVVLIIYATLVSLVIGIPLGVLAARRPWIYRFLSPILDMMQTIPTFVYLIPVLILFGLGEVPGILATVVFAIPAPIRLTYLGISQVPSALIEAGESFGCTTWQLLWRVELPHALPTIMGGVNQGIMLSMSMVVIAALVAAGGLGKPVVRAPNSVNLPLSIESGLAIVVVAIILDRLLKQRAARRAGTSA